MPTLFEGGLGKASVEPLDPAQTVKYWDERLEESDISGFARAFPRMYVGSSDRGNTSGTLAKVVTDVLGSRAFSEGLAKILAVGQLGDLEEEETKRGAKGEPIQPTRDQTQWSVSVVLVWSLSAPTREHRLDPPKKNPQRPAPDTVPLQITFWAPLVLGIDLSLSSPASTERPRFVRE